MKFTAGQKEALVRKATLIIQRKRTEKQEEYKKNWKPDSATKTFLNKLKKVDEARIAYHKAAEEAGFDFNCYNLSVNIAKLVDWPFPNFTTSVCHDSNESIYDSVCKEIMEKQINKKAEQDNVKFPEEYEIRDEIELATLDKSFDLDAFIQKYENL